MHSNKDKSYFKGLLKCFSHERRVMTIYKYLFNITWKILYLLYNYVT